MNQILISADSKNKKSNKINSTPYNFKNNLRQKSSSNIHTHNINYNNQNQEFNDTQTHTEKKQHTKLIAKKMTYLFSFSTCFAFILFSFIYSVNPGNQTDGDAAATLLKRSVFVAAHRANNPASEYPPMMQGCFFSPIYVRTSLSVFAAFSPKDSLLKTAGAFQGDKSRFQSSTLHAIRHNSSETAFWIRSNSWSIISISWSPIICKRISDAFGFPYSKTSIIIKFLTLYFSPCFTQPFKWPCCICRTCWWQNNSFHPCKWKLIFFI